MSNLSVNENFDDALVKRTLEGDEEAFAQLCQAHKKRVWAIARRFFRNQETAEDIVQETFAKAYFALSTYHHGTIFPAWLAKIAFHHCIDELRRRRLRAEVLMTDVTENETAWMDKRSLAYCPPPNLGEADHARKTVNKLLARLVPESQLVLYLLHGEECSIYEIAQLLGWSEARVKTRAFRARNELRRTKGYLMLSQ